MRIATSPTRPTRHAVCDRVVPLAGILFLVLGGALARPARADAPPTGTGTLQLRWDSCYGDGGADLKTFACNTNSGVDRVVFSATSAVSLPAVTSLTADFFVQTFEPTLPSWWQIGTGLCRLNNAVGWSEIAPAGMVGCQDLFLDAGFGGINFGVGTTGDPSVGWIKIVYAVNPGVPVVAGQELYLGTIQISHASSTGAGSCSGCLTPAGIGAGTTHLAGAIGDPENEIFYPIDGTDSDFVSWQTQLIPSRSWIYSQTQRHWIKQFSLSLPTDAQRPTWGAVKALYR